MRQDFFEFTPQFKLVIAGNHKPSLRSVDEAIRRRFYLVPFVVTIPEAERDELLAEKLRVEWPGILAWTIEGCLAWQRDGLSPPEAVKIATAEYMADEDSFGTWIAESCSTGYGFKARSSALYDDYSAWCERSKERPMASRKFSPELERRGYVKQNTMIGMIFEGIGLRSRAEPEEVRNDTH